jgi:rod shape-determining protein MreC
VKLLDLLQEKNIILSSFITVVIVFFLSHRLFVKTPGRLETVASYCAYPAMLVQNSIMRPFKKRSQKNNNIALLQNEVQVLKQKQEALQSKIIELEASKEFVQKTKELIKFKERYESANAQLCQVIMRRFNQKEQVLFVNAGSRDGIIPDMVAVYKNSIVGKVTEVFPHYSKVVTITDSQCKIAVYCARSKTEGIYEGVNNQLFGNLAHVDRLKKIFEHEKIYSSGQGTVFPKGFLVGEIESFEPSGLYYAIKIKPALNITELEYCYLIS